VDATLNEYASPKFPDKPSVGVVMASVDSHLACNVNPDVNVTESPFAYTTEPPELVAHPAKVYPVLVNAFDVNGVAVSGVIDCVVSDPPPTKFDLNVTVYEVTYATTTTPEPPAPPLPCLAPPPPLPVPLTPAWAFDSLPVLPEPPTPFPPLPDVPQPP
jgi:hypothetical protein